MTLSFPSGDIKLAELSGSVVIITGTGRSGKTTIGNLLGSCENTEHVDDPWFLMMLPILAGQGEISEDLALQMFRTATAELLNDRILLRHANFRPEDLSSIWKQKTPREIFSRLLGLYSSEDVKHYAEEKHPTLVLTLTDALPYWKFFRKALPECRVIIVSRAGLDVARDTTEKGWFSDEEHLRPNHANPYREFFRRSNGMTYYLPYWLETGSEERYLQSSEFARGLQYWRRMLEMAGVAGETPKLGEDVRVLNFEHVLDRPREVVHDLVESLVMAQTALTEPLLAQITRQANGIIPDISGNEIELEELAAARTMYLHLGMPCQGIDQLLTRIRSSVAGVAEP